jgi:chromate transporter
VSCRELFLGFLKVGVQGFGGVMPLARRFLVDEHRWLDDRQFTEILSLAQPLPGPNILNVSIVVGDRFQGLRGALAAAAGLVLAPLAIVLTLATVVQHFGQAGPIKRLLPGISAAAAGLVVGTGLRLLDKAERQLWVPCLALAAFVAVAWLHLALPVVLLVLAPVAIAFGHFRRAREAR